MNFSPNSRRQVLDANPSISLHHQQNGALIHNNGSTVIPPQGTLAADLSQLPLLRARVRTYVHGVIQCLPSGQNCQAYQEAMQKCPDLVDTESDPIQFVRCCQYDILEAAKRLCRYWTERLKLFGSQRAFLPLVLTGTGALTPEDVHTIFAGYPTILPETNTGRKVVLDDRNNWTQTATDENKLRAWFYAMCIVCKDILSQMDGLLIGLAVLVTPRSRCEFDWEFAHRLSHLGSKVFPVRPCGHFVSIPIRRKHHLIATASKAVVELCRYWYKDPKMYFHVESEPNQILKELMNVGLSKRGIPMAFGGDWTTEDWYNWCQERQEWEEHVYKNRLLKKPPSLTSTSTCQTDNVAHGTTTCLPSTVAESRGDPSHADTENANGKRKQEEPDAMDANECKETNRRSNVLRCRRDRQRRKQEIEALKQEATQLTVDHEHLRAEQERLSTLLAEAQHVVSIISREDTFV